MKDQKLRERRKKTIRMLGRRENKNLEPTGVQVERGRMKEESENGSWILEITFSMYLAGLNKGSEGPHRHQWNWN